MTQQHAAFFDFDGTLIRGDSEVIESIYYLEQGWLKMPQLIRMLGPIATWVLASLGWIQHEWQDRTYIKIYQGLKETLLFEQGEQLFHQKLRHAFMQGSLDLIAAHRQAGALIVIASASGCHVLAPVTRFLKADCLACTRLAVDAAGRCTGKPDGNICIGHEKARQIRRIASEHNLDLAASYAYSDHHVDLPFLESVGHPEVINPTKTLEKIAKQRHWPIHCF
ncbi:MAG: HAD-IB family hydrolase [Myxococcota bacterium]|nr:HAD-IB family hydrolase [Myxococcota bacterium]